VSRRVQSVSDCITFDVAGIPVPKGSRSSLPYKGNDPRRFGKSVSVAENAAGLKRWTRVVGLEALVVRPRPIWRGAVSVSLMFRLKPGKATGYATRRPDLDKLERAVWDALTGVVYLDDSQITDSSARKRFAAPNEAPGVTVRVMRLEEF